MTSHQIACIVDGLIPLLGGLYGLIVLSKKAELSASLRKILKVSSIILIIGGILFIANAFF